MVKTWRWGRSQHEIHGEGVSRKAQPTLVEDRCECLLWVNSSRLWRSRHVPAGHGPAAEKKGLVALRRQVGFNEAEEPRSRKTHTAPVAGGNAGRASLRPRHGCPGLFEELTFKTEDAIMLQ
jgi:hypothetical protein